MKTTDEIFYGKAIADEYDKAQSIMQLGWMDWGPRADEAEIVQCLKDSRINHQYVLKDNGNLIILMNIRPPMYNNVSIVVKLTRHKSNYTANIVSMQIGAIYEWRWMKEGHHASHSTDSRCALINIVAKGIHIIEDFLAQSREIGRHLDIARQPV